MNDMADLFSQRLDTAEGKEKMAALAGDWIRDKLKEESYTAKVLTEQPCKREECQISVNHDTLSKIIHVEPRSRAMTISFRGEPEARFIRAPRAEAGFFTISSEKTEKTEQELQVYGDMPITKIIEDNSGLDIGEIQDREFTIHIEAAVQALQAEANSLAAAPILNIGTIGTTVEFSVRKGELARIAIANVATPFPLQRPDLVNLFKMMDGNYLRMRMVLIHEVDSDDVLQWTVEDFGDKMQSETTTDGYKHNTLLGRPYTRTIKSDILRPGNVYGFAAPEFLGKFYVLNNTKFYIDKVANLISWQCWKDIALAIVNIAAIRKLELYSCDATDHDDDSLQASVVPLEEDELGAVNNRVDSGMFYPQYSSY